MVSSIIMNPAERLILEQLDRAVRSARATIEPLVAIAERKLATSDEVLSWEPIPLDAYTLPLPASIRSSWVFILRGNLETGAERHPNSHQRMVSWRGYGNFPTRENGEWQAHQLTSEPEAPLEERWVSIPPNVWHQGVTANHDWVVVSFHTVPVDELIEERPPHDTHGSNRQRKYADG